MRILALLPFFLFTVVANVFGQYYSNQNKVWAFSHNSGVNFTSGSPVSFFTNVNTTEGTASVSSATGSLLFYTDGRTVYRASGTTMGTAVPFNCLSTSQAAVITEKPGSSNLYYVFSLEELNAISLAGFDCRLRVCQVDMSSSGGTGDIVPLSSVALDSSLSEKMIAIPGSNCDIWLLVHKKISPEFRAYRINSTGISAPVISTIGTLINYGTGVMKVSPNRQKIAVEVNGGSAPGYGSELYDFDPATGIVSGCQQLSTSSSYGAEFSPDGTKLYVFEGGGMPVNLCQYDITLPTTAAIVASKTVVAGAYTISDMRLGPDNKIYMNSLNNAPFLDCIVNPNYAGTACLYFGYAVNLLPGIGGLGLPNIAVTPGLAPINGPNTLCLGNTATYTCASTGGGWSSSNTAVATVTSTGVVSGITGGTSIISYSIPGCGTSTILVQVLASGLPISGSLIVCTGTTTSLTHPISGTWSSGSPGVATIGSSSGVVTGITTGTANITYVPTSGCKSYAVVTVDVSPNAGTITGPSSLCLSTTISLTCSGTGGTWSSSDMSVATVSGSGVVTGIAPGMATISYTVTNSCGTATATKVISVGSLSTPILGDTTLCIGSIATLTNATPGGVWSSSNASIAPIVTFVTGEGIVSALTPGVVTITYTIGSGCSGRTTVTVYPFPVVPQITGDTMVCVNKTTTLHNTVVTGGWSTSTGKTSLAPVTFGEIEVKGIAAGIDTIFYTVSNPACTTIVKKAITVYAMPDSGIITGTNIICKGAIVTLSETVSGGTWSSSNNSIVTIDNNGVVTAVAVGDVAITYSVPPNAAGCSNYAVYSIKVLLNGAFIVNGSPAQIKCHGDSTGSINISLAGNLTGPYKYEWSNGDTITNINNLVPGTYTVTVKDVSTQCVAQNAFEIRQPDSLVITPDKKNDVCKTGNGSIKVEVTGGVTPYKYAWSNNTSFDEITGLYAGNYTVNITDANNCTEEMAFVVADDICSDVVIPDVITPNGDGINDTWVLKGLQYYTASTVQIFDKWGDRVYDKATYYDEWYGQNRNGNLLPDGTYYYIVKLNAPNPTGGKTEMAGYVLIKR